MNVVVRVGDTVRRPAGPWTPAVHDLLAHLRAVGYAGAPEPLGIDDQGREVLRYVEGRVAWPPPDGWSCIDDDLSMRRVAGEIARLHDAMRSFSFAGRVWNDVVELEPAEILCHHDLAPWNLVVGDALVFIDWDLAAPGPVLADLGYAARAFAPMFPGYEVSAVLRRLEIMSEAWSVAPSTLVDAAVDRAKRGQADFQRRAQCGEEPWARMWNEGHGEGNDRILRFMEASARSWIEQLEGL
jgi:hypothetical protein